MSVRALRCSQRDERGNTVPAGWHSGRGHPATWTCQLGYCYACAVLAPAHWQQGVVRDWVQAAMCRVLGSRRGDATKGGQPGSSGVQAIRWEHYTMSCSTLGEVGTCSQQLQPQPAHAPTNSCNICRQHSQLLDGCVHLPIHEKVVEQEPKGPHVRIAIMQAEPVAVAVQGSACAQRTKSQVPPRYL